MPVDETVESFEALVKGDLDEVPEQAFFNVGGAESVLEKATTLERRGRLMADGASAGGRHPRASACSTTPATLGGAAQLRRRPDRARRPHPAGHRRRCPARCGSTGEEGDPVRLAVHGGFLQVDEHGRPQSRPRRAGRPAAGARHPGDAAGRRGRAGRRDRRGAGRGGPRTPPRRRVDELRWPPAAGSDRPRRARTEPAPRSSSCAQAEAALRRAERAPDGRRRAAQRLSASGAAVQVKSMALYSASLASGWRGVDLAQRARLRAHDERLGGGPEVVVADALEQLAVGDPGGGEEAVVPAHQVVGGEHRVEVVAGLDGRRRSLVVAGPQASLDLARPCT